MIHGSCFKRHWQHGAARFPVRGLVILLGIVCALSASSALFAVTIDTVPVGNPGNAPDPLTGNLYGAVSYDYRIGKTEVTNSQYTEFLNLKAASDPLGLYNIQMDDDSLRGGISRSGSDGSYVYTTKTNMGNKPVNFVSWYDAARFANWLNNGQGSGDTETGAYTLLGGTPTPTNYPITRNLGATWFLPSEDEWYKAAYHQPAELGGDGDSYWLYPTRSNSAPTLATADASGNISNPGVNVANYQDGASWNGLINFTTVGSAGPLSDSFYGTADQGGNLYEWNEATDPWSFPSVRGGSINVTSGGLESGPGYQLDPASEVGYGVGFRVATVPEPGTAVLAIIGCALIWCSRAIRPQRGRGAGKINKRRSLNA